jgi:hypothetical protein
MNGMTHLRTAILRFAVFGMFLSLATPAAQRAKSPPEAAPVIAVLKAVKESDVNAFRNAYSRRIREDKEQGDWGKNLKEARDNLKKMYGDYRIADFTFKYDGDTERGKVSFAYKHGKQLDLDVIKEEHAWKVDKR